MTDCEIDIENAYSTGEITEKTANRETELLNWYIAKLKDAISDEFIGEDV